MNKRALVLWSCIVALGVLSACSGDGPDAAGTDPTEGCDGSCAGAATVLTVADVQRVIAQGVNEAQGLGAQATIAVVDRVGNVLAVYRMGLAANRSVTIGSAFGPNGAPLISGGLEGVRLPLPAAALSLDNQAAIAKAITGAYLSSEGNAFSSRTASQIVQEHFNPGEEFQAGGPLFGVQFSQLACSDLMSEFNGAAPSVGPQRSPLGLSADPGGFPLYKNGTVVGGVGVLADGIYGLDKNIADSDRDTDEMIAYAASFGFAAPLDRRGDRITADGRTLRFSDVDFANLARDPASAPAFCSLAAGLIATVDYANAVVSSGVAFGQPASGIRADADVNFPGLDAFVLVDALNALRFPPRAGTDALPAGASLTLAESRQVLRSALAVANRARAQIRRPVGTTARVTISVVDTQGEILGIVRSRDAPLFGTDVSLQKARSAAFFSSATAAAFLSGLPNAKYPFTNGTVGIEREVVLANYVSALRTFLGQPTALGDGAVAYADRSIGNLARPFFADGIDGSPAGPLSKPAGEWSPFSTGLQLDVAQNAILQHVLHTGGLALADVSPGCAGVSLANDFSSAGLPPPGRRLANGLQIFAGSVPIYRGGTLVGAVGVSGDGIDQDDMIAFLGLHEAGVALNGAIGNAPTAARADTLTPQGVRLRYVQCPQSPFVQSGAGENVCAGK